MLILFAVLPGDLEAIYIITTIRRQVHQMDGPRRQPTLVGYEQPRRTNSGPFLRAFDEDHQEQFAPKRTKWNLDAEDIIQSLCDRSFTLTNGCELQNLPSFSDVTNYQITEKEQLELWARETRRLVDVCNNAQPTELQGRDEWFGIPDKDGYNRLDRLAAKILYAAEICYTDNELILLEHSPINANPQNYSRTRQNLIENFGSDEVLSSTQAFVDIPRERDRCYHSLVDYVTETLTRVLLRTADGAVWDKTVIAAMAKISTKLKVVGYNVSQAATISLAETKTWEHHLREQRKEDIAPPDTEKLYKSRDIQVAAAQIQIRHKGDQYFTMMDRFHQSLTGLVILVAQALSTIDNNSSASHSFETSCVIYDTGFLQKRSMICQKRSGEIGGSSNRATIHCASFPFGVCRTVLERLESRQREEITPTTPYTMLQWKWTPIGSGSITSDLNDNPSLGKPSEGAVKLTTMREVITALVPFLMCNGDYLDRTASIIRVLQIKSNTGSLKMCEEEKFLAFLSARTSNYRLSTGDDVTPVSASLVARRRALAPLPVQGHTNSVRNDTGGSEADSEARKDLREANAKISDVVKLLTVEWTVDETSIIIPYKRYCWSVLGFCAFLILGGLAIGLSVEERIRGVDPFNISIFFWALAAFLTLLFKSIRVREWQWRDFFLGQVACKSVSEVVAASNVDAQLLLSALLHLEPVMHFEKRGPFGNFFKQTKANEGFSN